MKMMAFWISLSMTVRTSFHIQKLCMYSSKTLKSYSVSAGEVMSVESKKLNNSNYLIVETFTNSSGWVYYRYKDTTGLLTYTASSLVTTKIEHGKNVSIPPENARIASDPKSDKQTT